MRAKHVSAQWTQTHGTSLREPDNTHCHNKMDSSAATLLSLILDVSRLGTMAPKGRKAPKNNKTENKKAQKKSQPNKKRKQKDKKKKLTAEI